MFKQKLKPAYYFKTNFKAKCNTPSMKEPTEPLCFTDFLYFIFYHFILSYFDGLQVRPAYTKAWHYFKHNFEFQSKAHYTKYKRTNRILHFMFYLRPYIILSYPILTDYKFDPNKLKSDIISNLIPLNILHKGIAGVLCFSYVHLTIHYSILSYFDEPQVRPKY